MTRSFKPRLAPWGVGLAFLVGMGSASAQDRSQAPDPRLQTPGGNLPANPSAGGGQVVKPPGSDIAAPPASSTARPAGSDVGKAGAARKGNVVMTAEGVVTRVDKPGKALQGELTRFAFDPSQDWNTFVEVGAVGLPTDAASKPKTTEQEKRANVDQHAATPDAPRVLEMVVTNRSMVSVFARSTDGTNMYGVTTMSSPNMTPSTAARLNQPANTPLPTNFTNIKEGSFVSVRYHRLGDLNVVLNVSLIELPLTQPGSPSNTAPTPESAAARASAPPPSTSSFEKGGNNGKVPSYESPGATSRQQNNAGGANGLPR